MAAATKKSPLPHESDIEFEYENAIGLNDKRALKGLIKKKWPLPKYALRYAYMCRHYELFPILLDAGADPNYIERTWTLIGDCILEERIRILKMLLAYGGNPNYGTYGIPAIVLAARVGNVKVLRLLIDAGANLIDDPAIAPNALFEAVGRGHKEIVQFLIERGVSFRSRKRFGKSALDFAKEKGMTEILDMLRQYKKRKKCA